MIHCFNDHLSHVNTCRFSPDGTLIASGSDDKTIKIFDIRSGRLIQHYDAHSDKVNSISYHASGNYLISSSDDSTIKIWDLKMGQILYTVHGHQGKIKSVNFSKEGDYFCSGGEDSILMVWKSNIKNMDEEFNTLSKATNQTVTMSNKRKINLEETKENYDNNFINEVQMGIEGGENIINGGKIPNKYFANKYKVTIEKGIKNAFMKTNNNINTQTQNLQNTNSSYQNNSSAMINNSQINPFAHLPTELASSFDKMITQLEIITKTMKIMSQRIQTVEGQVEELYNMRRLTSTMNNMMENNQNIFNQNLSNENSQNNQIQNQEIINQEIINEGNQEIIEDGNNDIIEDGEEQYEDEKNNFEDNKNENYEENEKENEPYEIPRDVNDDEILEPNENIHQNPDEVFEDKENENENQES